MDDVSFASPAVTSSTTRARRSVELVDPWLVKTGFYHGYLPREDIIYLLKKHGDFIVRTSEVDPMSKEKKKETVVSVLMDPDGKFDEMPFGESRQDMVNQQNM
ncbi:hypothetical protein OSTOST_20438 [Ostertagia ostertagi]